MKYRYLKQTGSIAIDIKGETVRFTAEAPVHEIPKKDAPRLDYYLKDGSLEVVGKKPTTPKAEPDPSPNPGTDKDKKTDEDEETEPFEIDKWLKTWNGDHLPPELNTKTELKGLSMEQLKKMCKALDISDKGSEDTLIAGILEEFEG